MANQIGPFLLGEHLTAVTIAPVTTSGAALTVGAATTLIDVVMGLGFTRRNNLKDIRPLSVTNENFVLISKGYTARLRTLQLATAEVLEGVLLGNPSQIFVLAWTQGGIACSGYFRLQDTDAGVPNREENEVNANFMPIAIAGGSQMTYNGVGV